MTPIITDSGKDSSQMIDSLMADLIPLITFVPPPFCDCLFPVSYFLFVRIIEDVLHLSNIFWHKLRIFIFCPPMTPIL
jgi:hypothetical protein